jgi:hypothetical protein
LSTRQGRSGAGVDPDRGDEFIASSVIPVDAPPAELGQRFSAAVSRRSYRLRTDEIAGRPEVVGATPPTAGSRYRGPTIFPPRSRMAQIEASIRQCPQETTDCSAKLTKMSLVC